MVEYFVTEGQDLPDNVDDLLDALPAHQRNKVLSSFDQDEVPTKQKFTKTESLIWWTALPFALALAAVGVIVGIALMVTIILAPIGFFLMVGACMPFNMLITWRVEGSYWRQSQ